MANADRITELYKGEIWDAHAQRVARDRIDWLVGQARGAVLDVGCSQGIASILCARRGLPTLGIDAEADRIEYAVADRAREPEAVLELVEFREADACDLDLDDTAFDTVLLGEVVEHHVDASSILAEAARVLRPGGVLALTTPFGYLPHPDHRATFYAGSLLDLLAPHVSVESLNVVDGYFRAVCRPVPMSPERHHELLAELQPVAEREFARTQRSLREATARLDESAPQAAALERQRDELAEMTDRLRGLEDNTARLARVTDHLDEAGRELRETRESARAVAREQEETISALQSALQEELRRREDQLHEARRRDEERGNALDAAARRQAETEGRLRYQTYRTRYVAWQLESSFNRRWWRLGQALWNVYQHPTRWPRFPADVLRALRRRTRPTPPRRPPRPAGPAGAGTRGALERHAPRGGPAAVTPPDIPEVVLPGGPVVRPDLTAAVILDEFSAMAFRYEWRQVEPGPEDWREVMERECPDLLFVESAWRGNDGRWLRHIQGPDVPSRELRGLVSWCRERRIPTVFWNKEDPPNFDFFIDTAKLFDWVFTVDGNCLPRYRDLLGHDRVGVLPFGAQPRIHNPVSVPGGRRHDVVFAGTYYAAKHPRRQEQMETVLAPAREFGLHIFSRVRGRGRQYEFPAAYLPHIVGSLPYDRMLAAYKSYRVFLNVNSVVDSPTMCARRVFELAASSTPVLSGYSPAIEAVFDGLVPMTKNTEETRVKLDAMLASRELRDRNAHLAMREVLAKHTYGHRVDTVLETLGVSQPTREPAVSVIAVAGSPDQLIHAIEQAAAQRLRPIQLVLVLWDLAMQPSVAHEKAVAAGVEDVTVLEADGSTSVGRCRNAAIDAADGEFVAQVDDSATYGVHYLSDLVSAYSYTAADVVGKRANYVYLPTLDATILRRPEDEHKYVDHVEPSTMMARRELLTDLRFDDMPVANRARLQRRAVAAGARIYSADRFSYSQITPGDMLPDEVAVLLRSGRLEFYGQPDQHALI